MDFGPDPPHPRTRTRTVNPPGSSEEFVVTRLRIPVFDTSVDPFFTIRAPPYPSQVPKVRVVPSAPSTSTHPLTSAPALTPVHPGTPRATPKTENSLSLSNPPKTLHRSSPKWLQRSLVRTTLHLSYISRSRLLPSAAPLAGDVTRTFPRHRVRPTGTTYTLYRRSLVRPVRQPYQHPTRSLLHSHRVVDFWVQSRSLNPSVFYSVLTSTGGRESSSSARPSPLQSDPSSRPDLRPLPSVLLVVSPVVNPEVIGNLSCSET